MSHDGARAGRDPADVTGAGRPDHAEIALCHVDTLGDAAAARAAALLDEGESDRAARFVFARDRRLYTLAHGFLRLVLAGHLEVDPRALRFVPGAGQRPELAGPDSATLRFNLSHTQGLVGVVLAAAPCGIDVESLGTVDYRRLVDMVLARAERAELLALPEAERRERFLEIWTLKEAYLKGIGLGLSHPLDAVTFTGFSDERRCNDTDWRFFSFRASAAHRAAATLYTGGRPGCFHVRDATRVLDGGT